MTDQADTLAFLEEYHARNGEPARPCKVDGCDQPAATKLGPYGGLCAEHKQKLQKAKKRPQRTVATLPDLAADVEKKHGAYVDAKAELELAIEKLQTAVAARATW